MDVTSCYLNNALNTIHERAPRLICNDHEKSFNSILTKNNQKPFTKKLGFLAIEIYKFFKIYKFQSGLSAPITIHSKLKHL